MNDDRIDFSALDPARDADLDARISAITRDATAARRAAATPEVLASLAEWWRPALLAAGLIIAAAIPALLRLRAPEGQPTAAPRGLVGTLGIPASLNDLLHSTRVPSIVELSAAMNPGGQ